MADRPVRRPLLTQVEEVERLTPGMVRVVLSGADLEGFGVGEFTDHYVKLQFPPVGAGYAPPFDPAEIRSSRPREEHPRVRTYTVRAFDPDANRLTIDFVVHGDEGVAGPWANHAKPGDALQFVGPGGGYTPAEDADWHLMVGDAAVIPAISASLRRIPAGRPVHVLIQLDGPEEEQPLDTPGALHLQWLHERGDDVLAQAARAIDAPGGAVHAFVHGEAASVRAVRRHLIVERGVPKEQLSASGYWRRTRTDEQWREDKAEWNRLVEEDAAAA
ncbi:MAG: siderophore-interacting protein [Solirubrobacteraceae bacterium]|nr:siderophore-interacting protein [Solirubrobacteraceae bacterium]